MRLALTISGTLLHALSIAASTNKVGLPSERIHPRALVPRDGRDCGKFVMYCEKAAGACNNACYHINCFDKNSATMVYDAGNTNTKNRQQSGCETANGAVCNKLPFSQKFHDPFNSAVGDTTFNCDEWPMATTKQDDFKDGTVRNSLRCIPSQENSSGGAQVLAFTRGVNKQGPQKTCDGDIRDGDHWTIDFNYDNTPDDQVKHCKQPDSCDGDPFQFHLTKKPNLTGKLSFPYDIDGKDNHYAIGRNQPDLLQCRVTVNFHGPQFEAAVYDVTGAQKGIASARLEKKGDSFIVKGLPLDLAILRNDNDINPVAFNYGAWTIAEINIMKFFFWESDRKGTSNQYDPDGKYCKINVKSSNEKSITCYFPCPEQ